MTELEAALARLRRLEDERAVAAASEAYGIALDTEALDDWLDLFTEDGRFAWRPSGGDARGRTSDDGWLFDVRGRDALRRWAVDEGWMLPMGRENHVSRPPLITRIEGDEAEAVTWYVILRWRSERIDVISTGRYLDRLVRGADGRWRFRERLAEGVLPSGLDSYAETRH